ncbi:MAG: 1-acyl-sn-glycerol-3-phosphate acyltransferase [Deltaproteobacteria bacterium]|nr:1-acyl-sn-glycerol-3-phosphate acyltransferase [Deltaproteobacteria bacterium]
MRRDPYPAGYEALRRAIGAFARAFNRLSVVGEEHVPPVGQGALLVASHEGMADPIYVCVAARRRFVRPLAEKVAYDLPFLAPLMRVSGAIPVPVRMGRALDAAGAKTAQDAMCEHLAGGGVGLIFPEGTIKFWTDPGDLRTFRSGAVRMAARAGVPIVPVSPYGSRWSLANVHRIVRRNAPAHAQPIAIVLPLVFPVRVEVAFGPPVTVDPRAAVDRDVAVAESARVREAVRALRAPQRARWRPV